MPSCTAITAETQHHGHAAPHGRWHASVHHPKHALGTAQEGLLLLGNQVLPACESAIARQAHKITDTGIKSALIFAIRPFSPPNILHHTLNGLLNPLDGRA